MRRLLYSLSLTITLLPGMAQAQPVALSLSDAKEFAVKNNANAKNARLDKLLQEAKNSEITGLSLPQIKGSVQYTQFLDPLENFFPAGLGAAFDPSLANLPAGTFVGVPFTPIYGTTASVSGSQILFDGSVVVALQARNTIVKLAEQSARLTEEELRYNVERSYYSFVIAQRQYDILKRSLTSARMILGDVQALQRAGFAEKIEVDRTSVQVNNLATDSIRVGSMITLSEQVLKFTMGMDIHQPIVLIDTSVENMMVQYRNLANADIDYTNRTDYSLLETQLKLNQYDLKRHKLSALPSLILIGNAGYNYSTNTFGDVLKPRKNYKSNSMWGLTLNVPIFDGLQRRNRVKQAELSIMKTRNSMENLKLGIDFQTAQARTSLRNSLLMIESQRRNLDLANSVLGLAETKYKEGVGSNLEVAQARTEYLQAQNNYFQSLLEVVNAQADLQRALGQFK
jgi:outer membrane protein